MDKDNIIEGSGLAALESRLVAAEDRGDTPVDVTRAATVEPNPEAIDLYSRIGQADAATPGADVFTGPEKPKAPSAEVVSTLARSPVDALGQQFQQVKAAYAAGSYGKVLPKTVTRFKALASLWPIIVVMIAVATAGGISEVVYGQHAAALLSGATPDEALVAAIAFTLVFNGAAFFAAHMAYEAHPTLVRNHGVRALLVVLLLVVAVAAGLGLVVGGYDPMQIQSVEGGGAVTTVSAEPDTRPLLSVTYFGIIVLITVAIAAGHLLLLHLVDVRTVDATKQEEVDAEGLSLSWGQARDLGIEVARSYLDAIPAAHQQGRHRVGTRNAAFRRASSPEIGELFEDAVYDDTEPEWASGVRAFIEELEFADPQTANLSLVAS